MSARSKFIRAFSLFEMLLAIAVTGLLLTAASYLMVSLSAIWTIRTEEDSFEEHADGVAVFIQKAFDESYSRYQPVLKTADDSDETDDEDDDSTKQADAEDKKSVGKWTKEGVTLSRYDSNDSLTTPLLHFFFFQFPPALGTTTPHTSLGVESWLKFDEKLGLAIVWKDIWSIQETTVTDDKDLLRSSLISPFVTRLDFIYWDSDRKAWIEYDSPKEFAGTYTIPKFIRLTFSQTGRDTVRMIHVPSAERKMPLF